MSDDQICAIAVAQGVAVIDDVEHNLETLSKLVASAAEQGADIVVTPELFATGYAPDRAWRHDGEAIRVALAALARTHRVGLVGSSIDSADDVHHIAASFFSEEGEELSRIHKRHLFGAVERQWMTRAAAYGDPVAWRGASWGVGVCYDVEFPEFARSLSMAGAHILLVPTAVPTMEEDIEGLGDAWRYSATLTSTLQVPARALENGIVVAYANHCGAGFTGRSCIATPAGHNAVLLGDSPGVAVVEIPLAAIERARTINTYLADVP